jgi:hypothetical protein
MKKLNLLETSKAIMFLLIGAGIFMFGAASFFNNPVKADHEAQTSGIGKIMMHQNSFVYDGHYYYQILVWDSETGKSKIYDIDNGNLEKANYSLPTSPLY